MSMNEFLGPQLIDSKYQMNHHFDISKFEYLKQFYDNWFDSTCKVTVAQILMGIKSNQHWVYIVVRCARGVSKTSWDLR